MADNNPPASAGTVDAPSTEELIEDISNLMDDQGSSDPVKGHEDDKAAEAEPEDDPLGLDADAEDVAADDADDPDGPDPEIKGGRFAPDTAKVTLDDGTVTTIAELKRGTLFQRDYTKKTQELSKEKETFAAEREQVSQYAQQLDQSREYLAWYAENHLPKQPEPFSGDPTLDPMGFMQWQHQMAGWQTHAQAFQTFQAMKKADDDRKAGETAQQQTQRHQREAAALLQAIPVLKDPVKGPSVWNAIVQGASQHYGISAEDVNSIRDHNQILILRDALAYRRIKAKAPEVQAQVAQKPAPKTGRRAPPNAAVNKGRTERLERLKRDPSFENGAASLMDFDL